ncbi:hypothetical protein [Methanosarcina horonobensis]|uniref:hypothetical protein n=1 Tax=Methanosarcina horonobensis TaxID=418008 RepID=UPI000ABE4B4B
MGKDKSTEENISRCKCPQCSVQADSPCAQDKIKSSREAMEYMPQETSHIRSISLGCIAQKRSHDVRTLTLTDNAFVIRVMSGKSMVSKIQIRIITSVSMAEQLNY